MLTIWSYKWYSNRLMSSPFVSKVNIVILLDEWRHLPKALLMSLRMFWQFLSLCVYWTKVNKRENTITFSMWKPISGLSRQYIYTHVNKKLIYGFIVLRLVAGAMLRKGQRKTLTFMSCTSFWWVLVLEHQWIVCIQVLWKCNYGPKSQNRSYLLLHWRKWMSVEHGCEI